MAELPALTPARKALLALEVLRVYVPAWRMLRTNDLRAMVGAARSVRPAPTGLPAEQQRQLALRLGAAVMATMRILPTDKRCLVRSLVTLRMLTRRDLDAKLLIGVRSGDEFAAHAWVEHNGEPVIPRQNFDQLMDL